MRSPSLFLLTVLAAAGCAAPTEAPSNREEPPEPAAPTSLAIDCSWSDVGLTLEIWNGEATGYLLGMAEVGDSADPWTGEDCGYLGYTAADGTRYELCHDLGSTGATLVYVDDIDDVVEGSTTHFSGRESIDYSLLERSSDTCWTWGATGTYFDDCVNVSSTQSCAHDE